MQTSGEALKHWLILIPSTKFILDFMAAESDVDNTFNITILKTYDPKFCSILSQIYKLKGVRIVIASNITRKMEHYIPNFAFDLSAPPPQKKNYYRPKEEPEL